MAEKLNAPDISRIDAFCRYLTVMSGQPGAPRLDGPALKQLYEDNKSLLLTITPQEIFAAFTRQLAEGQTTDDILQYLDKIINVLHRGLSSQDWSRPQADTFLAVLMAENDALLIELSALRGMLSGGSWRERRSQLLEILANLAAFDSHYLKKENILFPSLEKADPRFDGLTIMWSLHDQARNDLQRLTQYLSAGENDDRRFSELVGRLLFSMHGLVIKETLLLFPAASEVFSDDQLSDMLRQSFDFGFALIDPPARPAETDITEAASLRVRTETGELSLDEALMLFNTLPVDISYVDENNLVRFFNKAADRIFPRSPAVIGRHVKRCHPAASVHVVEQIIEAFRSGKQEKASFWIDLKGRKVLIQYFALHSAEGAYRGVLEVSQDITGIRQLEGQRRLLQWEDDDEI